MKGIGTIMAILLLIIIVIGMGGLLYLFINTMSNVANIHSETRAFKNCDYYIEYDGQQIINITQLGCY